MAIDGGEWIQPIATDDFITHGKADPDFDGIADSVVDHIFTHTGKPNIAVIIPAYNEELTIGSVVLQARRHANVVLVVNDGSKDRTSEVARAAGAEVIDCLKNGGKASALRIGFNELKKRDFDVVVMMDGDGQHDVRDINALITPILENEADLAIGSRFMKKDNSIPLYRQLGQRILNRITNISSSKKVTDTQSGFRAFNRRTLLNMNFQSTGYAVEQDMIIHCSENGLRITEVPISVRYDVPNGHKQGSLRMGMALLNSVVSTIGYKRPLLLFGIPGFVFFSAGLVMAALTLLDVYLIGTWVLQGLMAGFMIIVGTTLVVSALSLNSLSLMMKARNLAR